MQMNLAEFKVLVLAKPNYTYKKLYYFTNLGVLGHLDL
jgi:hypothetical protein